MFERQKPPAGPGEERGGGDVTGISFTRGEQ